MKNLIIVLFLFLESLSYAQSSFSLGFGGSNLVRPDIPLPTFSSKNVGFIYQYDLSSRLALEYELRYSEPKFIFSDLFKCNECGDTPDIIIQNYNVQIKFKKLNSNVALNYKLFEKKWFQWRIATGPNINYYNGLLEGPFSNFDFLANRYTFSFVGKNYLNIKLSQHFDLQFITILNLGFSEEYDTQIRHFNTALRYRL